MFVLGRARSALVNGRELGRIGRKMLGERSVRSLVWEGAFVFFSVLLLEAISVT